ncbi:hypothetical protein NQ317_018027 [Molorchus minor]|uniref:DUF5641 domain-containing protein n=1 Tax=Molorchus minor TaxID=1323400 RepID=A0ABQ9JRZ4_9CUCU|nr:hypothetical protein NQ317_018027 [Molorchus minor]
MEEACQLYKESVDLFAAGKFKLTKWSTNAKELLQIIPAEERLSKTVIFKTDMKILGMQWNPETDSLSFNLGVPECMKRIILSTVAQCFDPIGLIAPFILYLKLLVKELWRLKIDWDSETPSSISRIWSKLHNEWRDINKFEIPRHDSPISIIAFADASNDAYGGVVYVRSSDATGNIRVCLVCAKSKVSPVKRVTIPRLELCAVLLLSKLVKHVVMSYSERIIISKIWVFSDSTTVIQWLYSYDLKDIFVANRVAQIRENLPNVHWRHVDGNNNPADCLSRGLSPSQLIGDSLWLSEPKWLKLREESWPVTELCQINKSPAVEELILINMEEIENHPLYDLILRCSSWHLILRVTVWVLRFLKILQLRETITAVDLFKAELTLVRLFQLKHFGADIQKLNSGLEGSISTKLRKLQPFIQDGLLRVGGRLSHAQMNFEQQHPLLLPATDPFVIRLIDYYHGSNLHTGSHLLEALIRQKYWIISGRNVIRSRVHKCNRCFRLRPTEEIIQQPNRLDRFQLIDKMVQDFWKRWHLEYLTTLQVREKWNIKSSNITVGTVVLLKVDNSPPLHWPLAIINEVHPGKDGTIRVVTVKTSKGTFTRPVVKVCPLPNQ